MHHNKGFTDHSRFHTLKINTSENQCGCVFHYDAVAMLSNIQLCELILIVYLWTENNVQGQEGKKNL